MTGNFVLKYAASFEFRTRSLPKVQRIFEKEPVPQTKFVIIT